MTLSDRMSDKYGLFMDITDLAGLMRIKRSTLYNQIYNKKLALPFVKRGKRYLFPTAAVASYLEEELQLPET
jgi:excisionase family DNA binding protein